MSVHTLDLPTSFQQEEIGFFLELVALRADADGHEVLAYEASQLAANARNTAEYLRAACHRCAGSVA